MGKWSFKLAIHYLLGKYSKKGKLSFFLSYINNRHRIPNLSKPKDLSEIWFKRILDGKIDELYWLADKYEVRSYVRDCGLDDILTPLLGVYERAEDIDFNILPKRFALKANWGAGNNVICTDKQELDIDAVRYMVDEWLHTDIISFSEPHYSKIKRRLIAEEFIDDGSGGFPVDYKFICINGRVHCILWCSGRDEKHSVYLPYSVEWKPLYHYYKSVPSNINVSVAPKNLQEMINVAEKLSGNIDLVRIDLYSNGTKIWFGEITLSPAGCIFHRWSNYALDKMGEIYRDSVKDI